MKFFIATLALFGVAFAQLDQLPDCAKDCVAKFTSGANIGDCPQLNAKCICSSSSFLDGIACCLADVCDAASQQKAVDFARSFCGTQGVQVPQSVSCASTASRSSTSAASVTSTPSSTSAAPATTTTSSVTRNVGHQDGPGAAGFVGGLVAALAFL